MKKKSEASSRESFSNKRTLVNLLQKFECPSTGNHTNLETNKTQIRPFVLETAMDAQHVSPWIWMS